SGVASCRWVRPILTIAAKLSAFAASVDCSASSAGSRSRATVSAEATFIAVGNTSLDDWPRLTSSFGCTSLASPRSPPKSSDARLASTSLTFMLVCVPDPVCQTASGNSPACAPTRAALRLTISIARISAAGIFSVEMRKCSSERCVCAPHNRSAGTSIGPNVSRSVRVADWLISVSRDKKRGAARPLSIAAPCASLHRRRLLRRSWLCRGGGSRSIFGRGLHRQAQPALVVGLEHLDLDDLAFLDVIGDLVDALLGDLRDVQQTVLAGQDLHDRAEIEQAEHRAFVDASDFHFGGDFLDALLRRLAGVGIDRCDR